MDRRRFIKLLGMGAIGVTLGEAIPFNRVWSFPKKLVIPCRFDGTLEWITMESLALLKEKFRFIEVASRKFDQELVQVKIGSYAEYYSESSLDIHRALRAYRPTMRNSIPST
jgi:hypothetical protein